MVTNRKRDNGVLRCYIALVTIIKAEESICEYNFHFITVVYVYRIYRK